MQILKAKAKYSKAAFVWVQEEPENMGAWPYICRKFHNDKLINLDVISRPEGSSTATGFARQHAAQQLHIVSKAFDTPAGKAVKAKVNETAEKMAHVGAD
jgi:2-oxoglutarate dehydrogenase E1 component